MANQKFYLQFNSDNYGTKQIDEPVGFDTCDFQLKQEDKRYARDISFAGGEAELTFYDLRQHELEQILYYNSTFGFESKISLIIDFEEDSEDVVGQIDFKESETDGLTYFKCKIIQDSKQALLKRRKEIKVNLLSDKDLDGNPIDALIPIDILVKSKPIKKTSEWGLGSFNDNLDARENEDGSRKRICFNPATFLTEYDIQDSYSFFESKVQISFSGSNSDFNILGDGFKIISVKEKLKNVKINIPKFMFNINTDVDDGGDGYCEGGLVVKWGNNIATANQNVFFDYHIDEHQNFNINEAFNFEIPFLNVGDNVWLYFYMYVRQSDSDIFPGSNPTFEAFTTIDDFSFSVDAFSETYNSVTPAFRLYDVMKYVIKSTSGMDIYSPKFQPSSDLYNQFLFNGNFLRNITDKPFYITLKDIEDSISEFNSDYEIQPDNSVFVGMYEDFYREEEIGFFNSTQFDSMTIGYNPRYTINEFIYKWKNYQSQKENTLDNTYDSVHGESQWLLKNINVENKKEVSIGWIRDAFMIEENRRKALTDSDNKATQDDDKLFIIDGVEIDVEEFKEVAVLLYQYDSTDNVLIVNNGGVFNWVALGLNVGDSFNIISTQNYGMHEVLEATNQIIKLQRISVGVSNTEGEFIVEFIYELSGVGFMNWTKEGFSSIENINNGDNYSNLRFSNKRNILNFWQPYLATANQYHSDKNISNTFYKNNPEAITVYNGDTVKEADDFTPTNQILTPVLYKDVTFICEYQDFVLLKNKIRTERGFIRFIDNVGIVKKGFPFEVNYSNEEGRMVCQLEEKHEPYDMDIRTTDIGYVLINNYIRVYDLLFRFENKKLLIFDEHEEPLFNPIDWNRVGINGVKASSINELKEWLNLL